MGHKGLQYNKHGGLKLGQEVIYLQVDPYGSEKLHLRIGKVVSNRGTEVRKSRGTNISYGLYKVHFPGIGDRVVKSHYLRSVGTVNEALHDAGFMQIG